MSDQALEARPSPRAYSRSTCRSGKHPWTPENVRIVNNIRRCVSCLESARVRNNESVQSKRRNALARLKRYGLTPERYAEMLEACAGCCESCGREFVKTPHIDHDHSCCPERKKSCGSCVRGLLCDNCNQGIGRFGDNPERLRKAAEYLERF